MLQHKMQEEALLPNLPKPTFSCHDCDKELQCLCLHDLSPRKVSG